MLTGRPPFLGGTMLQKLLQHQADQPPDLRQFRPELPEDVNRILRKMLAKDPRRRYSSPMELVNDLLWVARASGLRPAVPGGRTWTVPISPVVPSYYRHLPWIVSLLALVAIVAALDYLWAYMPGPASPSHGPAAIETGDGSAGAPPHVPSPIVPAVPAPAKATGGSGPGPVRPILPGAEVPVRKLSPTGAIVPALGAAAEKSGAERSVISATKPADDDLPRAVPKDNGEKGK
jgi:serine/threonine-protein kinase